MKAWGLWLYGTTTMYTDVITVHCSPAGRLNIIALGIDLGAGCYRLSGLHQFSLVTQSCPTLCDPMNCSTPGLPVYHQLPEFTQTHVHWVSDAIQLSHSLLSPSPPAPNPSQHQRLFQWVNSSQKRWPKYLSFSFSIIPSKEHPGLISFKMDYSDRLVPL